MKKILFFLFTFNALNAQSIGDTLQNKRFAYVETGLYGSTGKNMSFWLYSNQYGTVSPKSSSLTSIRAGIYYDHDLGKNKKADWGFGLNAVGNINSFGKKTILLPEAYAKVRYKWFDFFAGRKREIYGLVDSTLSAGSFIWSGNALPLPKLYAGWNDYRPILGRGIISLKGNFSHGWFGNQPLVNNYFLHQKSLYGRIGRSNSIIKLFGGFNHQAQWGGTPKVKVASSQIKGYKYPTSFQTYIYTVSGVSLIKLTEKGLVDTTLFSQNDALNRVGNHLGSLDIAGEIDLKKIRLHGYRQQFYEDGKLTRSKKIYDLIDALNGLSIYIKGKSVLKQINVESFYSIYQGADRLLENGGYGYNSYFNHGQYLDGWSYNGFTIGTPFITPKQSPLDKPLNRFTANNRVKYISGSMLFQKNSFRLTTKSTYATYITPYNTKPIKETSVLRSLMALEKTYQLSQFKLNMALDIQKNIPYNLGYSITYRRILE